MNGQLCYFGNEYLGVRQPSFSGVSATMTKRMISCGCYRNLEVNAFVHLQQFGSVSQLGFLFDQVEYLLASGFVSQLLDNLADDGCFHRVNTKDAVIIHFHNLDY